MPQKVRIALDAMGGDHGPSVVVPGAALALAQHPDSKFILFGDQAEIEPLLAAQPRLKAACRLVHTDVAVRMDDKPSQALRNGRWKSSMWLAIDAVKKGEADVAVSAGNTGALMAMAKFNLQNAAGHRAPGDRGALADAEGHLHRARSRRLDRRRRRASGRHGGDGQRDGAGAVQIDRPSVGLLNIGVEEVKGLEPVREAGRILREDPLPHIDYIGFVEGDDIGQGKADVVVTEGFAGNIALKTAEGTARQFADYLRVRDFAVDLVEDRLSVGAAGVPHAARQDGSAQIEWRRFPRPQRRRHQEPRRHRRRKASPPRSTWATTWCATNCSPRSAKPSIATRA